MSDNELSEYVPPCTDKPETNTLNDDEFDLPVWMLKAATPDEQAKSWAEHCQTMGIVPGAHRAQAHAPASLEEKISDPPRPDLYAESKRLKTQTRLAKLKAGLERKKLAAAGITSQMPLSGRAALEAIRTATASTGPRTTNAAPNTKSRRST